MRRRALTTTKILSVAFAVLPTACSKPDARPEPAATTSSVSAVGAVASASADTSEDPKLVALAGELGTVHKKEALDRLDHFRPLCDEKGYPLVGNLPTKNADEAPFTPSQLCAEVRKKPVP